MCTIVHNLAEGFHRTRKMLMPADLPLPLPAPTLTERLIRPLVQGLRHPVADNLLRLGAVEDTLRGLHPM